MIHHQARREAIMRSFALPVLAVCVLAAALAAAPDFVGTWIGRTEVPGAGMDELTLVVQKKEDVQAKTVAYAVAFTDTLGYAPPGTEVREIKVEGDSMTFQFNIVDGSLITGKLILKDDTLVGVWANVEGEGAEMRFERKK
jgi:hypothetical protein